MSSRRSKPDTDRSYYPAFFDISGKTCIVIGGGRVAERKVRLLLRFHALVKVISPKIVKGLKTLQEKGRIEILDRAYGEGDLDNAALVFAATDDEAVNARIKDEAAAKHVPVNVVDSPAFCDFIVPSIVKKGPIVVAISTSGTLPLLSKKLRKEIESLITEDYVKYVEILGAFRRLLILRLRDKKLRHEIMKEIGALTRDDVLTMGLPELSRKYLGTAR